MGDFQVSRIHSSSPPQLRPAALTIQCGGRNLRLGQHPNRINNSAQKRLRVNFLIKSTTCDTKLPPSSWWTANRKG